MDCKAKSATLQDGSSVSYDTLVVATGGRYVILCFIVQLIRTPCYSKITLVKSVDCKAKSVTLQDGSSVSYDTLVVATGGK